MFLLGKEDKPVTQLNESSVDEDSAYRLVISDAVARFSQLSREEQQLVLLLRSGSPEQRKQIIDDALEITGDAVSLLD
jgi:hypothetical protein